jgi:signal transduction histidine kinase
MTARAWDRGTLERMWRQRWIDVGIAAAAFAGTIALMLLPESDEARHDARDPDLLGIALAAASSLPLLARRRAPLAVFVVCAVASSVLFLLGYPEGPPVGPTVALYFLALSRPEGRRRTVLLAAFVAALFAMHITLFGIGKETFPGGELLLGIILWSAVWIAADRTRLRRERMAELEERAQRAEREAERERRLAAAEERARIARDLHDSAGHAINVILVQAGAARLLQEQDPDRAREALETVEDVARDTIREIDRMVGALRDERSAGVVEPPRGLAALETLAERYRDAGLDVDVRVHGPRRTLAPGADQAAFRIVQEALTNAARHGEGGTAEVDLAFGDEAVEITVTNPIPAGASLNGERHGLVGMRERAALLGGSMQVDATDGLFRVRALLPYAEDGE